MDAKVEIVKIGPKRATELLDNLFPDQRPINKHSISSLAGEMIAKKWRLSSDCLVLIAGKLANGQHRLHAIVQSDTTQPFLVMETDDNDLYKVLDCGKKRTVADVLRVDYAAYVASVARAVVLYDLDAISLSGGGGASQAIQQKGSRSQVIQFVENNEKALSECVKFCTDLAQKFRIVAPTVAATLMFLSERDLEKPKKIRDFITHLYDGNSQNDAAHDLRERILRSRMGAAKLHRNYLLAIAIKSFNAYCRNTTMGQVKMNADEAFPRLKK